MKETFKKPVYWLIIVVLLIGIFLRFFNIDKKVYWSDETVTLVYSSGYKKSEVIAQVSENSVINNPDVKRYQQINFQRSFQDTIQGLAKEDSQHPPAYYLMLRGWMKLFGSSVAAVRSLSAILGVFTLICMYFLAQELFSSPWFGWVGMSLLAVSPFHLLYAQEAREFILLVLVTLGSSLVLLKALKSTHKLPWIIYGILLSFSLYTSPLFALVILSHGLYLLILERCRLNKTLKSYLLATLFGVVSFLPWLIVMITGKNRITETTGWLYQKANPLYLVASWVRHLWQILIDLDLQVDLDLQGGIDDLASKDISIRLLQVVLVIFIVSLVLYSFYFAYKNSEAKVYLFVFTLTGITALALVLPDLILGGTRSTVSRYLVVSFLGIHLSLTFLIGYHTSGIISSLKTTRIYQIIFILLLSIGILSGIINSQATSWWNKDPARYLNTISSAQMINQSDHPLVITEEPITPLLSLSRYLDDKVKILWRPQPSNFSTIHQFNDVYIYRPSQELHDQLKSQNFEVKPVFPSENPWLWKVMKNE